MNSAKFSLLFVFFLLCVSVNVFAGYLVEMNSVSVTTVANPNGPPNGPSPIGQNAYVQAGPPHEELDGSIPPTPPYDWIEVKFKIKNLSTNDSGGNFAINDFTIQIGQWHLFSAPTVIHYFVDIEGTGLPNPAFEDGYVTESRPLNTGDEIEFTVLMEADDIINEGGEHELKQLAIHAFFPGNNQQLYLRDVSIPSNPIPVVETYVPGWIPPPPGVNSLNAYLDPITCLDSLGNPASVDGDGVIRCDQIDKNTVSYEIIFEDINASHNLGTGHYIEINWISLVGYTTPQENRIMHYNNACLLDPPSGGCWYYSPMYYQDTFPPVCDFLHYNTEGYSSTEPGHTNCYIPSQTGFPEFSKPLDFIEIPACPIGSPCPLQDNNVFYNTNRISFKKYLNPSEFTLQIGERKIFKGNVTNAKTGGDFKFYGSVGYTIRGSSGEELFSGIEGLILDGSNQGFGDGTRGHTSSYYAPRLKLKGHEAFIIKDGGFIPSSPYLRPTLPWTIEIPIKNSGDPWDGTDDLGNSSQKDILFVDINILTNLFSRIESQTFELDGSDVLHTLDTDEEKTFFIDFDITEGIYHQFLRASEAQVTLYDMNKWMYDFAINDDIHNVRLITVLDPYMAQVVEDWGYNCFTDVAYDGLCWWNAIDVSFFSSIDLNAGDDMEYVLRLRSPFDSNEFFDLTYDTNAPTNARLEFEPERVFVPPFTSGTFGYKYAKMIIKNPKIIRGYVYYHVLDTSVNYPYVWDDLQLNFNSLSRNLKLVNFSVIPEKEHYSVGEPLDFSLAIKNTGNKIERDINFLVVSSMDPSIRFYAPDIPVGINDINPGQTLTFTGTLPPIPYKGVFAIEASVQPVEYEFNLNDNTKKIIIETEYSGDVSKLDETSYLLVVFISLIVLFVVRKK